MYEMHSIKYVFNFNINMRVFFNWFGSHMAVYCDKCTQYNMCLCVLRWPLARNFCGLANRTPRVSWATVLR